jgi:hypothetical protein
MVPDYTMLQGLVLIYALVVAWPIAHTRGKEWRKDHPDKLPFKWGHFQSVICMGHLMGVVFFAHGAEGALFAVWMLAIAVCGFYMSRRHRWAWVVGTLLSMNPVLWVVDGIYLKNRWAEMREEAAGEKPLVDWRIVRENVRTNFEPSETMNYRIFIPCVLLAFLLGALAHNMLAARYVTQAMGNGAMLKTDRWTGQAWMVRNTTGKWVLVEPAR